MKILLEAKPGSRKEKIEKIGRNEYVVAVKEPAIKGRSNKAIIKALAEYFKVSPSRINIKVGQASRNKIIEIL